MAKKKLTPRQILEKDLENMKKELSKAHKMVDDNREHLSYDDLKYIDMIFILRNQYVQTMEDYLKLNIYWTE